MLIKFPADVLPSEITPQKIFEQRREFLRLAAGATAGLLLPAAQAAPVATSLAVASKSSFSTNESLTPNQHVTSYNNYYEFGSGKEDPAPIAGKMRTTPWAVTLDGLVRKPKILAIEDIMRLAPLEERIYRLRCVEGWSMVIPWVGFPLSVLLKQVEPLSSAKYVEFYTDVQPEAMPGVRQRLIDFPYVEGLRLDEANHPLAIACVGLYGAVLPNQNGAPIRIVVPWKYGFKSAKSIVLVRFTDQEPRTAWMKAGPQEYGFYSNVNPEVDHRRWSQATERRLGEFLKRKTRLFNGYADQVSQLYAGMDLRKNF
ncbi:protein-methionine-sulfoxide reductase catalytic subunit MsrP [Denitratisoma oestradiolicum]|uniref:Protein-methionine-sulfoxide reductase catalytic subunit MsrP n=1 Tax=Denitratisoma oestradiolicum TaxID=311182 RepID=A0A6S6XWA7_9PROT|nr:protein-methionine-sulfoxide reductase catalytic subunit MsrP [Denitratisoma oestradiolicum]TWO82198.1 mononuclear molybdenum enzyme YedY [Denitratisoma oestradiolicum]CAB1369137.1 exported heme-molybdoenzyme molybdopterin-containing subunit YedY; TAT export [Denitratisoma oestradiolicum]